MKTNRLLITAFASLLALTACTVPTPNKSKSENSQGGGETSQPSGGVTEDTEITIWTTYNDTYQTIINNCIEEFEKAYPNIKVNALQLIPQELILTQ